jgi:hypothetical protein
MKKSNYYVLLLAGALGVAAVTALATKPAVGQSCCSAALEPAPADTAATTTVADPKIQPDLLTTCPVSGEKLGLMGKPFVLTNNFQEVKLCCPGCKKEFEKNADKYLAKIRAADKK